MEPEDLYQQAWDEPVSEQLIQAVNQRDTVPTGYYRLEITKKEKSVAGDNSPWPGRRIVRAHATLTDGNGMKGPKQFFDLSPEERFIESANGGRFLDGPASLWGHVTQVLGKVKSNEEVFDRLDEYPYRGYVEESFQVPQDNGTSKWRRPVNGDQRKEWLDAGLSRRNFVRRLGKLS